MLLTKLRKLGIAKAFLPPAVVNEPMREDDRPAQSTDAEAPFVVVRIAFSPGDLWVHTHCTNVDKADIATFFATLQEQCIINCADSL